MQGDHKGMLDHVAQWIMDEFKDKRNTVGGRMKSRFRLASDLLLLDPFSGAAAIGWATCPPILRAVG